MTKKKEESGPGALPEISHRKYKDELYALQVELVKLQRDIIAEDRKLLVILEGRDSAGKDGVAKRIVEHLSPRETRVVALGKPSDRQQSEWYFQRYAPHLPAAQELVIFNRSWYNRAGVERVMGFCTDEQYERFMVSVPQFEDMLAGSGIVLMKYYLDISKPEQKKRLDERRKDPLKQWKISPIDSVALQALEGLQPRPRRDAAAHAYLRRALGYCPRRQQASRPAQPHSRSSPASTIAASRRTASARMAASSFPSSPPSSRRDILAK